MNIFKKLTLINKILKIINVLKKHFEQNNLTKEVKEKVEAVINAVKDLLNIIPECKEEIEFVINIIKNLFLK